MPGAGSRRPPTRRHLRDGAQRPFRAFAGGISGKVRAVGSPESDDHRSRGGRKASGAAESAGYALAVREAGGQEVEELARDGPVDAIPGDARSGVRRRPQGWHMLSASESVVRIELTRLVGWIPAT